jgi:hypothetical protein
MAGNSWQQFSSSFWGSCRNAAVLLDDGASVLITGGTRDPDHSAGTRNTWIYKDRNLRRGPDLLNPRFGHTASRLPGNRVLLTGSNALDSSNTVSRKAEIYNATAGVFVATGDLVEPRGWHTATPLPTAGGNVLIVGGLEPARKLTGTAVPKATAEIYDVQNGTFRLTTHPPHYGYADHTATRLQDGSVLIVGGTHAEIFHPATETFEVVGAPAIARSLHAAVLLANGRALIAGGYEFGGVGTPNEEVYNPQTKTFARVPAVGKTAYALTLTRLPNGKVLAVGGCANPGYPYDLTIDASTWVFDQTAATCAQTPATAPKRLAFHTATALASGLVLVSGGVSTMANFPGDYLLYTPEVAALHMRFHGTGRGTVYVVPGGTDWTGAATAQADPQYPPTVGLACTGDADIQCAAGTALRVHAVEGPGWITREPQPYPIGLGRPPKVVIHHNDFEGWGTGAQKDMTNPMQFTLTADRVVDVNFALLEGTLVKPGVHPGVGVHPEVPVLK